MTSKVEKLSGLTSLYNHSAKEYSAGRPPERVAKFVAAELDFFVSQLPKISPLKVLDLGSGPGEESRYSRILCPGGVFQIILFEGEGEGPEVKTKYRHPRFFAYYQQGELRQTVSQEFEVIRESRLKNKPRNLLSITARSS